MWQGCVGFKRRLQSATTGVTGCRDTFFQGRYKAVVVDPEERGYSAILSDYIHLNPVRARMVGLQDRLVDYRWSSYPHYVRVAGRPEWLETDRVMGELGLDDTGEGRRDYARRMRERAAAELAGEEMPGLAELRRGWCLGNESFRERMLRLLDAAMEKVKRRSPRDSKVRREHGEEEARRLIRTGLDWFGMEACELAATRKGDERKLAIAALVRQRTSVSNGWLAAALVLGHFSRVSQATRNAEAVELARKIESTLSE